MKYTIDQIKRHIEPFNNYYRKHQAYKIIMTGKSLKDSYGNFNLFGVKDKCLYYTNKVYYPLFSKHIYSLAQIPKKGTLLSLGCGFGGDEKNINRLFPELKIWGTDLSEAMIEAAVKNNQGIDNIKYCLAMAESLPFCDGYFVRIISREVIEHVMEPEGMLKEIARILAPGGLCVITTPNLRLFALDNILQRYCRKKSQKKMKDEHLDKKRMIRMFTNCRLELKKVFYDGGLYFHIASTPPIFAAAIPVLENITRPLQHMPIFNTLLCAQVKYLLEKKPNPETSKPSADHYSALACPSCKVKVALSQDQTRAICPSCENTYYCRDGYYNFVYKHGLLQDAKYHAEDNLPSQKRPGFVWFVCLPLWWLLKTALYIFVIALILPSSIFLKIQDIIYGHK